MSQSQNPVRATVAIPIAAPARVILRAPTVYSSGEVLLLLLLLHLGSQPPPQPETIAENGRMQIACTVLSEFRKVAAALASLRGDHV